MRPLQPRRKPSITGDVPQIRQPLTSSWLRWAVLAIVLFAGTFLLFPSRSKEVVTDLRLFHHTPTHQPPIQKNSTSGDVRWFNDWKWLNPFSASVTLDDGRSVLPPLHTRPTVYTFYDTEEERDEKIRNAENKLLLIWRRAWWAQGFRPVVLGRSEAMSHPLYESFQTKRLPKQLQADFMRWLAFGRMGTGILTNWLCLPMGAHDDNLLSYLRRGSYPKLARYEGLDSGLFSGQGEHVDTAIKEALASDSLKDKKALIDAVQPATISTDGKPSAIAFYDANTIAQQYKPINTKLTENKAQALTSLGELILYHLQSAFLGTFTDSLAVLAPFADRAHLMTQPAHVLANALRTCPKTPIPESCPPNMPTCKPCAPETLPPISTPGNYLNSSTIYTIGTLPHPYTFASLLSKTKEITVRHIRRDTARDRWLGAVTQKTLGGELGGPGRLPGFKENVAGEKQVGSSFWMVDESPPSRKDVEYHFGFALPTYNETDRTVLTTPSPAIGSEEISKKEKKAEERDLQRQQELLDAAREIARRKPKKGESDVKAMVEAWNLADTEAWRFVRALRAREQVEREKWEQEERKFAGGEETDGSWRWFDKRRKETP
ncbi:uncharacterized protein KY384_004473 [Bacidia gigantensis]|uniref:uncharacterized protein n=1 Tax=Bacidia gigantensis TaxID=2732470 RepID=UPI001D03728E|nr:uncharacterized protein KY384_004473 [Bacidia gigantensis]KAG8531116.1 hypothetical protein KY384_004473 [Bacidia gigantensis]